MAYTLCASSIPYRCVLQATYATIDGSHPSSCSYLLAFMHVTPAHPDHGPIRPSRDNTGFRKSRQARAGMADVGGEQPSGHPRVN